jgi:hypothetical protein
MHATLLENCSCLARTIRAGTVVRHELASLVMTQDAPT